MLRGIVAVALVCALAQAAYADNKPAAKEAYTEGKRQYDVGDYESALAAFKKAYLNYEEPVFLFNIAQCYRALGDRPSAVRTYRAFLRNWPKAPNREQVERIIAQLDAAIAQDAQAKEAPPQDTLPPHDKSAEQTPAPSATPTPTPTPRGGAQKPAASAPQATTTTPSPTTTPASEPKPAVAAKTPPGKDELAGMVEVEPNFERPSGSGKPLKWWGWALITVGVGGVVAAAVVVGITQSGGHFDNTLPQFNVNNMGLRAVSVSF